MQISSYTKPHLPKQNLDAGNAKKSSGIIGWTIRRKQLVMWLYETARIQWFSSFRIPEQRRAFCDQFNIKLFSDFLIGRSSD